MMLVVGLGNPGNEYKKTRHNIGFMSIDELVDSTFTDVGSSKFLGKLYKKNSLLLLKPETFMNLSGKSVKAVCDFYKPDRVIVIHDELDLDFGTIKFKIGGGNAGHNGLKSIDASIGNDYERVRIGIGKGNGDIISHVLREFTKEEKLILDKILDHIKNSITELIKTDIQTTATKFTVKKGFFI